MKKFKFFQRKIVGMNSWSFSLAEVKLPVDEIPEFESEEQALDFYRGVYLAEQLRVDNYNKGKKRFWTSEVNELPEKVYIIQEFSI